MCFVSGYNLYRVAGCCSSEATQANTTWECHRHPLMQWRFTCGIWSCSRLHWPAGMPLPCLGFPCKEASRQLQWSQTHHLQHAYFLCSVGSFCSRLHQLTRQVLHSHRGVCNLGLQLRTAGLHLCTKVLYNPFKARKEHKEISDVQRIHGQILGHVCQQTPLQLIFSFSDTCHFISLRHVWLFEVKCLVVNTSFAGFLSL